VSGGGDALESDAIELLRALIREACVNDGSPDSGQEIRSVRVLQRFLADAVATGRVETQVLESAPGRASLIARVRGSDPSAPSLGLLGHLDVVPVDPEGWTRNPFGGDLIDGEIWGRGAVDMLYLTAVFACVLREVALAPEPPRGDLVLLAVADEEAGGEYGIHWLVREHPEAVRVSEAISESGGMRMGAHVAIEVAEKGSAGRRLVMRGKPGHASIPYGAASAAYRVGEVLQRLGEVAPAAQLGELWDAFVAARIDDPTLAERLRDPVSIDAVLPQLGGIAGYAHAVSRITLSPTVLRAGATHNVIPAARSTSTSAPCPARATRTSTSCSPPCSARSSTRWRSSTCAAGPPPHRARRSRCSPRSSVRSRLLRARRSCRSWRPAARTPGCCESSGSPPTVSGCWDPTGATSATARACTATTSASTWSRSSCRWRRCG
jgi:acetylornithine deacetylase/succinyl-diaminopimelate desuccinylase-like protein